MTSSNEKNQCALRPDDLPSHTGSKRQIINPQRKGWRYRQRAPHTFQTELHQRVCYGKFWVSNMSSQITKHTPVYLTVGERRKHISF